MAKTQQKPKPDTSAITGASPPANGGFLESAQEALSSVQAPNLLGEIQKGKKFSPPRLLVYGMDGLGKSSWAAQAPKPIFIQTEDGLDQIDCEKFPLAKSFEEVERQLLTVENQKHEYQTIVIDSLDWLERLIWDRVCRRSNVSNIEKVGGGFAKGYIFALDEWRSTISRLENCRAHGMAVILIAHAKAERFEDPENPAYDRWAPRLNKHADSLIREWVDATLFLTRRLVVRKEGTGFEERTLAQPIGQDGGERILRTVGGPAFVAKNRYDLPGELSFPKGKGWEVFIHALTQEKG